MSETVGTPGTAAITLERLRQIGSEGWSADHDDTHNRGDLAIAAASLILHGTDVGLDCETPDAWGLVAKHGGDTLRCLEIAGALSAAEYDRVLRREVRGGDSSRARM